MTRTRSSEQIVWAFEVLELLSERITESQPLTIIELMQKYPDLTRNTVKNRMAALVQARVAIETPRQRASEITAWTLDLSCARFSERASKSLMRKSITMLKAV